MKRILILVAISLISFSIASAQGGGGESTKTRKTAPKPTVTKPTPKETSKPKIPTPLLSSSTITRILESSWNYYKRIKVFLGPIYFGNRTSFGKWGDNPYA